MQQPTVSFVVPCYKLAHLLSQCLESIFAQTYASFEVLVMDDCSPDNTPEVAQSFRDPRIRHIRNDANLGPLRNYNKGIGLSRGRYVWLISADDYLRRPYVLQRYVEVMEAHPNIGYAFCPGVGVRDGREAKVLDYSMYGDHDQIVRGHVFLRQLLRYNMVLAASAMARRECYETISFFPLDVVWAGQSIDMVWGGDWFLWCMFALLYDVAYFAEPMVCYREHALSMTNTVTQERLENCAAADIAVLWIVGRKARDLGLPRVARDCLHAVATEYARHCVSKEYRWLDRRSTSSMTLDEFEGSLCRSTENEKERDWIRARVAAAMADSLYARGNSTSARRLYLAALQKDPGMVRVYAKLLLLLVGRPGAHLRKLLTSWVRRE